MPQEFWVVGGSYRDSSFLALREDGGELHGPFVCYEDALDAWRHCTARTRAQATVRYSVVVTAPRR